MIQQNTQIFGNPDSISQIRVEFIYNLKYGTIPSKLVIGEDLLAEPVLDYISKYFSKESTEFSYKNGVMSESSFWLSTGDKYGDMILETSESRGGAHYSGSIDDPIIYKPKRGNGDSPELCVVTAVCGSNDKLISLCDALKDYNYVSKSKIYLLANQYGEISLKPLDIPESKSDLKLNYGKKFSALHEEIISSLNNKSSGLYLFYGEPGTGKSSYIKHLLSSITERKIVYIPINLIDHLVSPDFIPLLMSNRNMILVIEDAEKALISREENTGNASIVSAILNLTDSFISSTLNVTIIATFNTRKDKLDKALLRKGRLKISHEFDKLDVKDAQSLVDSLGLDHKVTEAMTIADIYYLNEENHLAEEKPQPTIGFGS